MLSTIPSVAVLLFHAVGSSGPYSVPDAVFRQDLRLLRGAHVGVLSPADFEAYVEGRKKITGPSVLITFDDGSLTAYTRATPILRSFHMKAMAFLIGHRIGRGRDALTAADVRAMAESGVWTFEAHSYDLHRMVAGMPAMRCLVREGTLDAALRRDMELEASAFQGLGLPPPTAFSYPFGYHDRETDRILFGRYRLLFTSEAGTVHPGDRLIPRVNVGSGLKSPDRVRSLLESLTSPSRSETEILLRPADSSRRPPGASRIPRDDPARRQGARTIRLGSCDRSGSASGLGEA